MASLLPHFYATFSEQASESQLMTQDFQQDISCWIHPHMPSGYHSSTHGSKEVCWWEINKKEQGQKKCHGLIHWQYLLYSDHSSDVVVLCSTINMEEISLLNSCLGHLPGRLLRYSCLRVPSKYSAISALKLSWWEPDLVSHDQKMLPSLG